MLIAKWLKKYKTSNYRFVTYVDGEQAFIVDDGDLLNPVDVFSGDVANCFGYRYVVHLEACVVIKERKISLLKAKRIARRNDLFNKYQQFVKKVKEVEEEKGVNFKGI